MTNRAELLFLTLDELETAFNCQSLAFSYPLLPEALAKSVATHGVWEPLTAIDGFLTSGFRRLRAHRAANRRDALAIYQLDGVSAIDAFEREISKTQTVRDLTLIERMSALTILEEHFQIRDADLLCRMWLPRLGLQPALRHLEDYRRLRTLGEDWFAILNREQWLLKTAVRLAGFSADDRQYLFDLFNRIPFGTNRAEEVLQNLQAIGARDSRSVSEILESLTFTDAESLRRELRRRAYPILQHLEESFRMHLGNLHLPHSITIQPPPYFEGDRYDLHFPVRNHDDLRRQAKALLDQADSDSFRELFDLL